MSKDVSSVVSAFERAVDDALSIVGATEALWLTAPPASTVRQRLKAPQLEAIYEAIFLRIFGYWENALEGVTVRWMAKYKSASYLPSAAKGQPLYSSLAAATAALHTERGRVRDYLLWHNPATVEARVASHLNASPLEILCQTNQVELEHIAAIRHHIAHGTPDSRLKFEKAAIHFAGSDFGGRPGKMLRASNISDPLNQPKWIRAFSDQLKIFAVQLGS